ncbi:MAG: single-stranded DNA-binding protein [Candidatus Gastranaerophilales bacterium]|nr:single-stranded DNA-binding protein [Candidatus Gastranaerophilales bacterium]
MSLSKAVLSGIIFRGPEKRFTSNNIPIAYFTLNIDEKDETLVRVFAKGNLAELVENTLAKGDKVVVDGKLQNSTIQQDDGSERKIVEIDLSSFEKVGGGSATKAKPAKDEIVKFADEEFSDDLIGEEEIPF